MQRRWFKFALVAGLAVSSLGTSAFGRSIRVALVLYEARTQLSTVPDPFNIGTRVTEFSQLNALSKVYLEAWVSHDWPDGLTAAGLDVTYDASFFTTFCDVDDPGHPANCQIELGNWGLLAECPQFDAAPDMVCSVTGLTCIGDASCKTCVGGPDEGDVCCC